MSIQIQRRRGTAAQHATFTGADGEITIKSDTNELVVHDGQTAGGFTGGGFMPAGTGAQATTVQAKLRQTVSVFDFMTAAQITSVQTGTGSNVTAAIQQAIDYALDGTTTGTIHIPKGQYAVTSLNVYPTGGKTLVLIGDGAFETTFVKFGSGTDPIFNVSGTAGGGGGSGVVSKCQFKNFSLYSNTKTYTGFYVDTLAHFFLEGVRIDGFDIGLQSLGSLTFACRSCYFTSNNIGFQADQSPVNNGYSNLIKFDACVFQGNTSYHAKLNKGQQIVFQNCDCESGSTGFIVNAGYESETGYSSVTWDNCWWEGNTSNPIIVNSNSTWITMRGCNLYGGGSAVTINGSSNMVKLDGCYGTEALNMADSTGSIHIDNCLFPIYSISTPNQIIHNLLSTGPRISTKSDVVYSDQGSVSAPNATATAIAATGTNYITIVTAYITGASINETCSGIVIENNISNQSYGTNMSLSVSGSQIKVTQTTGITQSIRYSVLRIR